MKTKKSQKKLSLSKTTVAKLNETQMVQVKGGQTGPSICAKCGKMW